MQLITYPTGRAQSWMVLTETGDRVSVPEAHAYIHDETGTLYFKESGTGSTTTAFARGVWRQVMKS